MTRDGGRLQPLDAGSSMWYIACGRSVNKKRCDVHGSRIGGALVDGEHGPDALAEGLAQHGLGLHADALNDVDHHQRAVGDAQRRGDLGREVHVARGVDQVDQVVVAVTGHLS